MAFAWAGWLKEPVIARGLISRLHAYRVVAESKDYPGLKLIEEVTSAQHVPNSDLIRYKLRWDSTLMLDEGEGPKPKASANRVDVTIRPYDGRSLVFIHGRNKSESADSTGAVSRSLFAAARKLVPLTPTPRFFQWAEEHHARHILVGHVRRNGRVTIRNFRVSGEIPMDDPEWIALKGSGEVIALRYEAMDSGLTVGAYHDACYALEGGSAENDALEDFVATVVVPHIGS